MCIRDSPLSNGPELVAEQLQQIAAWSHQYPGTTKHEPVWVSLDVKGLYHSCCCGSKLPRGGWHESDAADPAECESAMWAAERMIQGFFGDKAVSVQDLRRGCHSVRAGLQVPMKSVRVPVRVRCLSLIHISEPTRLLSISYAVFCLKKKKNKRI
eukprot:TRINITY_DN11975_c0_g1_i2.p1 TRINITY_DN11975_c0_g1~~TRINITY_DN11975_c0_g1_i2.p1  ORF type:complete len:155 (-),score=31.16 TRINITY_DN11975_c0_g1_i2:52-516(-)